LGKSWAQSREEEGGPDLAGEGNMRLARDWSPAGLPCTRTAWSELWELTQARGCWLRNAETTFRVQRDLVEALNQVQV
jgi:hypothetical protein